MRTLSRLVLAGLLLAGASAWTAQAAGEDPQYEGIPSYSATRLKIFEGTVWVRTPDSGEWEEFQTNSPVPERARLSVPGDSEAELQFHGGQFLLLTGGTELDLRQLEDRITVFRLRAGEIRFDLPEGDFSPVRVLLPDDARVDLPVPGKYWLTAPENEDSRLVVRSGEATVTTGGGESPVRRGEEARIGGDVRVGPYAGGPAEDRPEEAGLSDEERQAGVPPVAATELREYGEWVHSTEYGYVWRPRVAPGWSPYYYGQWMWISPYGWTWISEEPWGWYPYHYGYWYSDPVFGWVWYPFHSFVSVSFVIGNSRFPHFHRHAFFVPATVRFVRSGETVRWVPLRPGERFQRIRFTRADRRLARWERPLPARTVYVRRKGAAGREWTDWRPVRDQRREAGQARTRVQREPVRERQPSTQVRPDRRSERAPEGTRERTERSVPSRGSQERERVRDLPKPADASPNRAVREERSSDRAESIRGERPSEESGRGRFLGGEGGGDRGGGSRGRR